MEIRYTIKVKDKHNPPEFKKGLGKGVVATQVCTYSQKEADLSNYRFLSGIMEYSKELLEEYFEVVPEVVDVKKERKEKLKKLKDV